MNKIVREHYPVSSLPEDLREGLAMDGEVRIVIEEQVTSAPSADEHGLPSSFFDYRPPGAPIKTADLLESIRAYKASHPPSTDQNEAVRRIRELRDEWNDE
ncbi:DUF349 domain-containing protein [Pararhizobium sp.]|uniref:DUF349 domain-containing protein n=1 Tax=Pararhizobium sp. TaxID=1977563 RepID=UPI00271ED197|nr:DUF349 domain-containing protein [Pararhizobium sp.]MDO9417869.1 DUF349 domain-containing protein [Pararhizobium sp.]